MKINTDGVLLGAWAGAPTVNRALDIGTGTGVIAMMLAQRFPNATVHALEPDKIAQKLASENFIKSPFADRLTAYECSLECFDAEAFAYDLIVSNPPYFLNSLKNKEERRSSARHTDHQFFNSLMSQSHQWLSQQGNLQLIVPAEMADPLIRIALKNELMLQVNVQVSSFPGSRIIRNLLSFSKQRSSIKQEMLTIYAQQQQYSPIYKELLAPFLLNF